MSLKESPDNKKKAHVVRCRGGLTHYMAGCHQCHGTEAHWFTKNAQGLAARHAMIYGHDTWVELGHSYNYIGSGKADE